MLILRYRRFHSISFPSEWGLGVDQEQWNPEEEVSIQLVSPASGDLDCVLYRRQRAKFPFN